MVTDCFYIGDFEWSFLGVGVLAVMEVGLVLHLEDLGVVWMDFS